MWIGLAKWEKILWDPSSLSEKSVYKQQIAVFGPQKAEDTGKSGSKR